MRTLALALLLAAAPAAARPLTSEEQSVTDCIRNIPIEILMSEGSDVCRQRTTLPDQSRILSTQLQRSAAREVIRYKTALRGCPQAKPGPKAGRVWQNVLDQFRYDTPDVPAIKSWINQTYERELRDQVTPGGGWCEHAKALYGSGGRKFPEAIVMRDGSTTAQKCIREGTCVTTDTIDVYVY